MSGITDRPPLDLGFRMTEELEKLIQQRTDEVHENAATVDMEKRLIKQWMMDKKQKIALLKLVAMANRLEDSMNLVDKIRREGKRMEHRAEVRVKLPLRRLNTQMNESDEAARSAIIAVRTFLAGL